MGNAAKSTRQNRTLTIDFHDETTYFALLDNTKAFGEFVLAFILSIGFQLNHKSTCHGGGSLTRHSHYVRIRLGGLTIWRIQCTRCKAVFTVLPHFVLRYRKMRPDVARDALFHPRWSQSGMVRDDLPYLAHGPLSRHLCLRSTRSRRGADPLWLVAAGIHHGR